MAGFGDCIAAAAVTVLCGTETTFVPAAALVDVGPAGVVVDAAKLFLLERTSPLALGALLLLLLLADDGAPLLLDVDGDGLLDKEATGDAAMPCAKDDALGCAAARC